ncbi:metallopeptidase TldD-related protein, partial [Bdellovibrionota bacterium FG-2]
QLMSTQSQVFAQVLEKHYFEKLSHELFSELGLNEHLLVGLVAETSQFIRTNNSKIRQTGVVNDASLELTLITKDSANGLHKGLSTITLAGTPELDRKRASAALAQLKKEVPTIPVDAYAEVPVKKPSSSLETKGELLDPTHVVDELLSPLEADMDLVGIYAAGPVVRAMANSSGLIHWFKTETFNFDYSLYTAGQRAVKNTYAGTKWSSHDYRNILTASLQKLSLLAKPAIKLGAGPVRAYLAPACIGDLISMFSWGCVGEAAIRQGDSPLRRLRTGEAKFSEKFSLTEDFSGGEVPRFNSEGDLAAETLSLIGEGQLTNTLINQRTALEYKLTSNGASSSEAMRAPHVLPGTLKEAEILKRLGTGVYLSNLHYLNWSDQSGGRITGMTRYACFKVENGEIIAPIENMRFDDTIFSVFGTALEDFTDTAQILAETGTYYMRTLGSIHAPGALLSEFKFTL